MIASLIQDLRYAFRQLRMNPGFAAIAVLTLALGSGATTVIFTVVSGLLLKPLQYPQPESLVTLHVQAEKRGDRWGFSYPDFLDCQRECRSFEGVAAWTYGGGTVSAPGEAEYVDGRLISSELFSVLRVPLVQGRSFLATDDRLVARRWPLSARAFGSAAMAQTQKRLACHSPMRESLHRSRSCAARSSIRRRSGRLHATRSEYRTPHALARCILHSCRRTTSYWHNSLRGTS